MPLPFVGASRDFRAKKFRMLLGLRVDAGLIGAVMITLVRPRPFKVPLALVSMDGGWTAFSTSFGGAAGGGASSTGDSGGGGIEVPSVRE
jgi:hypothetical protein